MLRRGAMRATDATRIAVDVMWYNTRNVNVRLAHTAATTTVSASERAVQSRRLLLARKSVVALSQGGGDVTISVDLVNAFHEPMTNPLPVRAVNRVIRGVADIVQVPLFASQPLLCNGRFRRDVDQIMIDAFMSRRLQRELLRATYRQKLGARFRVDAQGTVHDGEMEIATGDTLFDIEGSHVKIPGRCLQGSFMTRMDTDGGMIISLGVESVASLAQNTSLAFCQLFKGLVTRPIVGVPRPLSPAGEQTIKHFADLMAGVFTPCGKVNLVFPQGPSGPMYVALRGTVFPSAFVQVTLVRPDGSETMYRSSFLTPHRNPLALGWRHLFGLQTSWNTVVFPGFASSAVPQIVPDDVKRKYENVLPVKGLTLSLTDVLRHFEEGPRQIASV